MSVRPTVRTEHCDLYLGDCRDVLPSVHADLFITSPPYNLGGEPWPHLGNWKNGDSAGGKSKWRNGSDAGGGVQYGLHDDSMPWPEYVAWQQEVLTLMWAAIPEDGAIFYNHKPRVIGARLWMPLELIPSDVLIRQIIVWARPGGMNFNPTAFVPTHEWIMVLGKPGFRLKSKAVSGMGDVWRMTPDSNQHPAPFPLELPRRAIQATGPSVVGDPFAGSGTVAVACIQAGVKFIGCEIDPQHFEAMVERVEAAEGIGTLFAPKAADLFGPGSATEKH